MFNTHVNINPFNALLVITHLLSPVKFVIHSDFSFENYFEVLFNLL